MAKAKNGDTVKIQYTGKLEDGSVFEASTEGEPLQFTIGSSKIIPGLEEAVVGMNPGESKTVKIPSDEGYGPHRREMVMEVDRNQVPENIKTEVGQQLQMTKPDGQILLVRVTDVSESSVTFDANHPLAGKDLTFDIKLLEVA
jgi:peptidylprolyl isomerase